MRRVLRGDEVSVLTKLIEIQTANVCTYRNLLSWQQFSESLALNGDFLFIHLHRREHRVRVVRQMPAREIHILTREVGGADALVAGGEFGLLGEALQFFDEDGAAR